MVRRAHTRAARDAEVRKTSWRSGNASSSIDPNSPTTCRASAKRSFEHAISTVGRGRDESRSARCGSVPAVSRRTSQSQLSSTTRWKFSSALARRHRLGALTNGNADIARLGLDRFFRFAFSAADVGAAKPAPEMFRAALLHTSVMAAPDDPCRRQPDRRHSRRRGSGHSYDLGQLRSTQSGSTSSHTRGAPTERHSDRDRRDRERVTRLRFSARARPRTLSLRRRCAGRTVRRVCAPLSTSRRG